MTPADCAGASKSFVMRTPRFRLPRRQFAAAIAAALVLQAGAFEAGAVTKSAASGKQIFLKNCANCHGADATGRGPAASSLTTPPPDLTQITRRAGGTFPAAHVTEVITYGGAIAAHGSSEMPVWGKIFSVEGGQGTGGANYSRRAVVSLKRYLETIQQ